MDISLSKAAQAYKTASAMGGAAKPEDTTETSGASANFMDLVAAGLEKARGTGYNTEATTTESLANKTELVDLVTAVSNAELTLNTVVSLRDKMINAYQDILRMPI
jgi:flagellar hook-basal body complex protein FliE